MVGKKLCVILKPHFFLLGETRYDICTNIRIFKVCLSFLGEASKHSTDLDFSSERLSGILTSLSSVHWINMVISIYKAK